MKFDEIKDKSIVELNELIIDLKKEMFEIRFKKSTNKYENTTDFGRANSRIKELRKTIARAKTLITQKSNVCNV